MTEEKGRLVQGFTKIHTSLVYQLMNRPKPQGGGYSLDDDIATESLYLKISAPVVRDDQGGANFTSVPDRDLKLSIAEWRALKTVLKPGNYTGMEEKLEGGALFKILENAPDLEETPEDSDQDDT